MKLPYCPQAIRPLRSLRRSKRMSGKEFSEKEKGERSHCWNPSLMMTVYRTFLADCMEGQLIMLVVILAFFAMFLLREWIMQNTPPDLPVNDVIEIQQPPRAEPIRFAANVLNEATSSSSDSESDSDTEHDSDEEETATRTQPSSINDPEFNDGEGSTASLPTDEENNQPPNAIDIQWHAPDHAGAFPRQPAANNILPPPPQLEGNAARQALLARQLQANQQPRNNEEDFEFDNAVDDLDGVLEAIGLRGNIMPLGQHAALMILLIAGCLGSAVWTPYIVGKAFILVNNSLLHWEQVISR